MFNPHLLIKIIAVTFLITVGPFAMAQGDRSPESSATIEASNDPLAAAWEGGKLGALIGLGAGGAVSMMGYAFNSDMEYGRVLAGTTGAGFIGGAVYGFVRQQFFPSFGVDDQGSTTAYIKPDIVSVADGGAYGLSMGLNF